MIPQRYRKQVISGPFNLVNWLKNRTTNWGRKLGNKFPQTYFDYLTLCILVYLSLITTYIIVFVGVTIAPSDFLSSLINWHAPEAQMVFLAVLSVLVLVFWHLGKRNLIFAFRDFMVRIYTIFNYGALLGILLLMWSALLDIASIDTLYTEIGPLWIGLSILGMLGMYTLRTLPWLQAFKKKTQNWAKSHALPPFRNQDWHLHPPIEDEESEQIVGYSRPNISEIERRELAPAIWRALLSTILVPSYLVLIEIVSRKYSTVIPNEKSIKESGITIPFEWAGGFVIPNSVISSTLKYFDMSSSEAVVILLVFSAPIILIAISSWNISYVWEEVQYRVLNWGIEGCGFSVDNPSPQLLLLFGFNILVIDSLILLLFSILAFNLASLILTPLLSILVLAAGMWSKRRLELIGPERAYNSISLFTVLLLIPWLMFVYLI